MKKYHIGIFFVVVCISCMAESSDIDDLTPEKLQTVFGKNQKEAYTIFKNKRGNRVYAMQEHLVGKLERVDKLDDRITFLFTGMVDMYVSNTFWGTNMLPRQPVRLEIDVRKLSVTIDWMESERDGWPVAATDVTGTFQKLSEIEASQKTVRIAIDPIQPVFDETGGLVMLKGVLLAILE